MCDNQAGKVSVHLVTSQDDASLSSPGQNACFHLEKNRSVKSVKVQQDALGTLWLIGWCVENAANGVEAPHSGMRVRKREIRENMIGWISKNRGGVLHTCDSWKL